MDTRQQWLSLAFIPGLGPATLKKLVQRFGSARQILAASRKGLEECPFLRKDSLAALCDQRSIANAAADRELHLAEKAGTTLLCWDDPLFPPLLKEINDPPVILHVLGAPQLLSTPGIAMVGARAASSYGLQVAGRLATELARHDLVITSGFALGIDTAAHRGALAAGGKTIAVMGCGLDIVYPSQNRKLHAQIAEHGAIISESPLGTQPEGFRFPARNRIISGLSLGVVVVEAAHRSGTLITAHQALEQGRDVFAIPGRIDSPKSEGCHRLIQEGAKLVHSSADILEELALTTRSSPSEARVQAPPLPPEEGQIFALLEVYPRNIEEIILAANLPPHRISEILLHLELRGLVASLPGNHYQRLAEPHSSGV
ncbi:MAG: DNA protecting protein DprA [Deltaproteobacteria bacterium RIFOXYD12_FULL_56_24]|nr:MAG: DNA protecting protein DprA [Deltaproteobacteria bacterium RIFOXYD12_FULL_56_24]